MATHIIIDGYNLIRRSPRLWEIDVQDLQAGREALLKDLAEYRQLRPHKITVVFDAANAPADADRRSRVKGINIRFSRPGESADAIIKRMAAREREKAVVVSSDRDVADYAERKGAAAIDAPGFEQKMEMARVFAETGMEAEEDEPDNGWTPTTRKKGPSKRLSKRRRFNRGKVRKL